MNTIDVETRYGRIEFRDAPGYMIFGSLDPDPSEWTPPEWWLPALIYGAWAVGGVIYLLTVVALIS